MSGFTLTVTNAGRAALINAANTGTAPVVLASVGVSATAVTPTPSATSLPDEIKRITTLSGDAVADDTIHVTIRDESADVYSVHSLALYLADGTLFALYGQAQPIMEKSAQAMLLLAVDVIFADIDAQQIAFGDTNFLLPPATTERPGQVELATTDETTAGVDATRAVTPKGLKAAVANWLDSRFGEGAPSDFIKSLLTSASAAALRLALGLKSAALKDEGSGKGLDADLLDGQHGSFYTNIVARLGYTPWGPSNDGAGSGLDADLLDGLQASAFARLSGATFTGNVELEGTNTSLLADGRMVLKAASGGWTYLAGGAMGIAFRNETSTDNLGHLTPSGFTRGPSQLTVWDAGNDGSGSGLDADLLDGQHGSYYSNVVARLGYTPWGPSNDGAGSGLDADLLDGLQASAFAQLSGADFTGPISSARSVFVAGTNAYYGDGRPLLRAAGGGYTYLFGGATGIAFRTPDDQGNIGRLTSSGFSRGDSFLTVWDAGNDGSGSGLDADLLDGLHASDFAKLADFVASKTANGYCRFPNGMILQAGRFTAANDSTVTVSFPIAFPNLCMGVVVSGTANLSADAQDNNPAVRNGSVGLASFQVFNAADTTQAFFVALGW